MIVRILLTVTAFILISTSAYSQITGCLIEGSANYNPEATVDCGCCYYLGDMTGEGDVTLADINVVLATYGSPCCCEYDDWCLPGDFNFDGHITVFDVSSFLAALGTSYIDPE